MAKKLTKQNIISLENDDKPVIIPEYVEDFLDKNIKEFGFYVIETRALPSIYDGLRIGARKIMYAAMTGKLKKGKDKMTALIGDTMSLELNHGDSSLKNTIEQLASEHLFKYCPLKVLGQMGKLRGDASTAARYLKVEKSQYFDLFTPDSELYDYKVEDGKVVEPQHLFPLIPPTLLWRTNSPGFGFSFRTFSYRLEDVIDGCIDSLINGKCDKLEDKILLKPEIVGIKPENIIYNENKNSWYNVGEYEIMDNMLIIKDLPYHIHSDKFEMNLKNLEEKNLIKSWANRTKKDQIHYTIIFHPNQLQQQYKEKWKFYARFNLFTKIRANTLNVLDANGKTILNFENENALIDGFVMRRLNIFRKRKFELIKRLEQEIIELDDKAKFLKLILDEKLIIIKRPIADVKKDCDKFGVTYEGLKLSISKQTKEEYEKYLEEIQDIKNHLDYIKRTPEKEMYLRELIELREKMIGQPEKIIV